MQAGLAGTLSGHAGEARTAARANGWFLAVVSLVVAGWAGFNWLVNPYAMYPTRILKPRIVENRRQKILLLRKANPQPRTLILGSSRMMRFEPSRVEMHTGATAFNAAVTGCSSLDALALYRYASEVVKAPIDRVILGVEPHTVIETIRSVPGLHANPELARLAPGVPPTAAPGHDPALLLSPVQTQDSLRSVRIEAGLVPPSRFEWDAFQDDGWQMDPVRLHDSPVSTGVRRRANDALLISRMGKPGGIDDHAVDALNHLLALLQARRVRTVVVATPTLDPLRAEWDRNGFRRTEQSLLNRYRELAVAHGARFVDFTSIDSFSGRVDEFNDSAHPTVTATRKMVDALFRAEPDSATARKALPPTSTRGGGH